VFEFYVGNHLDQAIRGCKKLLQAREWPGEVYQELASLANIMANYETMILSQLQQPWPRP
jgi:hypothetical protein